MTFEFVLGERFQMGLRALRSTPLSEPPPEPAEKPLADYMYAIRVILNRVLRSTGKRARAA